MTRALRFTLLGLAVVVAGCGGAGGGQVEPVYRFAQVKNAFITSGGHVDEESRGFMRGVKTHRQVAFRQLTDSARVVSVYVFPNRFDLNDVGLIPVRHASTRRRDNVIVYYPSTRKGSAFVSTFLESLDDGR